MALTAVDLRRKKRRHVTKIKYAGSVKSHQGTRCKKKRQEGNVSLTGWNLACSLPKSWMNRQRLFIRLFAQFSFSFHVVNVLSCRSLFPGRYIASHCLSNFLPSLLLVLSFTKDNICPFNNWRKCLNLIMDGRIHRQKIDRHSRPLQ